MMLILYHHGMAECTQYGIHNKSLELERIASFYSVPNLSCAVLFDDSQFNKRYADKVNG